MKYSLDLSKDNVDEIINEYNKQIKKRTKKTSRIWGLLLLFYMIIMVMIAIVFPGTLKGGVSTFLYFIYGGVAGAILLVGLLISSFVGSEKPFHNVVMKEIVDYMNKHCDTYLEYTAYPKKEDQINKRGGLFTRFASMDVKDKMVGKTNSLNKYTCYNMRLYTSDGKNQITIFSGIYFVIQYSGGRLLQIRTHSKPKLKGKKFEKLENDNPLRIYVAKDEGLNVEERFIKLVSEMKTKLRAKKIFFSTVNNEIHFAFEGKKMFRKPKNMDKNVLEETFDKINLLVATANEIVERLNNY
ncbi:hypothetical protein RI065_09845 [Mycoplasmatota bacterium zrk1]